MIGLLILFAMVAVWFAIVWFSPSDVEWPLDDGGDD